MTPWTSRKNGVAARIWAGVPLSLVLKTVGVAWLAIIGLQLWLGCP